ncbi:MAG: hypothetical protein AB1916_02335 [Thermodesulfobacteriota bacterium]
MRLTLTLKGSCGEMGLSFLTDEQKRRLASGELEPYAAIGDWFLGDDGFGDYSLILHKPFTAAAELDGRPVDIRKAEKVLVERPRGWKRSLYAMRGEYDWMAVLGYDDDPGAIVFTWSEVEDFDPARLAFLADRWDKVLETPGYLVLREVLYAGRRADETGVAEHGGSPTLWPPRYISIAEVRARSEGEIYNPDRDGEAL